MSLRVARVITRLNVGGPAYQAVTLNHLLAGRGYETLLIAGCCDGTEMEFAGLLEKYPCEMIRCRYLGRRVNVIGDLAATAELSRELCRFSPDIVHTHTAKAGCVGRVAARVASVGAVVHTFHGHVFEGYFSQPITRAILACERTLARMTDMVITPSSRLAGELIEKFKIVSRQRCRVVELGVPLDGLLALPKRGAIRDRLGIGSSAVVLGSLGRLVKIKNFARLIDSFADLVKSLPERDVHLVIGGTGPLDDVLAGRIGSYGLTSRVHMIGFVDNLPQFYADIDVAIMTSDSEGTPVMLIEAQAAGRFVVAPDVGGVADIVADGMGAVVRPNVTKSYTDLLRSMLVRDVIPVASQAARQRVVERFSPQRLADEIDGLYRGLLQ